MYKIKLIDYNEESIWELFINAIDCLNLIADFYHFQFEKPESYRIFNTPLEWILLLFILILDVDARESA